MISLDLNLVRVKDAQRAELAQQVAQFLAGNAIQEAPLAADTARPLHFVDSPAQVKERTQRQMEAQAKNLELATKARTLAETMTIREVGTEMGMTRYELRGLAKRHRITFQPAQMSSITQHAHASPEEDARDAERLRAYAQCGVSINHASCHSGIGRWRSKRLAKDFNITFLPRGKA